MRALLQTVAIFSLLVGSAAASDFSISGRVIDSQGYPVSGATVQLAQQQLAIAQQTNTSDEGRFEFHVSSSGEYAVKADAEGFEPITTSLTVTASLATFDVRFVRLAAQRDSVSVTADVPSGDILFPDPAQRVLVREELLDANPGRPGAPVSLPGLPIETASSGIKAPQYFAPGVAGDHGEPIAQYLQVGTYLVPNNLSANAHGNGYSDPNVMISGIIESVQVDGGAFNAREGNHSVDLAAIYGFRDRLDPFLTVTGDSRDVDLTSGWSPGGPNTRSWVAIESAYGNGLLDTLEHRQQYKINAYRVFDIGEHRLTLFGIGYFGQSKVPGLVPIDVPGLHDTIDPRQRDQTHTGEIAINDVWRVTPSSELQLSSFFRTYNLSLFSNFGDGLIRQSEFRTVQGSSGDYVRKFGEAFSTIAGAAYNRDAPRQLDLDHYGSENPAIYGQFTKVTSNNVTIGDFAPYLALDGNILSFLHYNLGWRRDEIEFDNTDLLAPAHSYRELTGFNSPKANIRILNPKRLWLPEVAFSFGETFFTNDPRIGLGTMPGTLVSRAQAYQMVVSQTILHTDFRVTLAKITTEQSLAKIDPDTGLQEDEGAGRNRFITASARHFFRYGLLQASVSKADARDLSTGLPTPEAPRLIVDLLGTLDRLPFHLHARAEYEEVGSKPLGDGFISLPVHEFRGALARSFDNGRLTASVNFLIASGYTGQTTEVLALPGDPSPFERVVGVYLPSYATVSFAYHFGPHSLP